MSEKGKVLVGLVRLSLQQNTEDRQRLCSAAKLAQERLYVVLEGNWSTTDRQTIQHRLHFVYDELVTANPSLDARVLLPSPGAWIAQQVLDLDAVLASPMETTALKQWNQARCEQGCPEVPVVELDGPCPATLGSLCWDKDTCELLPEGTFDHTVLGGTFDRIHAGHKVLLALSAICTKQRLLIGISVGPLLAKKVLKELISPYEVRRERLTNLLSSVRPNVCYEVVPIEDPFGPSIVDPLLQCIVVSRETEAGGNSVNRRRAEAGLSTLTVQVVDLVGPEAADDTTKVSSTGARRATLGRFCGEGLPLWLRAGGQLGCHGWVRCTEPGSPYVIGLTGGICAGKTTVVGLLAGKGAVVVDCDKLGHKAYVKGSRTFGEVVGAFGEGVVDAGTGEIDRRKLGAAVFGGGDGGEALKRLNGIVWPAIRELAGEEVRKAGAAGAAVCVMEAAVLLEAGWDDMVDEVWALAVPEALAVERLRTRNSLDEEAALQRVRSQMSNQERLSRAHVALYNPWTLHELSRQVDSAWAGVAARAARTLYPPPPAAGAAAGAPAASVASGGVAASVSGGGVPAGVSGGGLDKGEEQLLERWRDACEAFRVGPAAAVEWYRRLWGLYTGPRRHYHNLQHLAHMFDMLSAAGAAVARPGLVAAAVFFHDAVYDPTRGDNEARSADLFDQFAAGGEAGDRDAVGGWIRRTAAHHDGPPAAGDAAAVLDADLAVLGAGPAVYGRYAEAIRREYSHLGEREFVRGRLEVIEGMLARPALYYSKEFRGWLEARARANLWREVGRLRAMEAVYCPAVPGWDN